MKKLLSLLGVLAVSAPLSLSVVACADSQTTYDSITDGLKDLKINSYGVMTEDLYKVQGGILQDILVGVLRLNFSKKAIDNLNLNIMKDLKVIIINKITGKELTQEDLKDAKTLELKVSVTLTKDTEAIEIKSARLNITDKVKTDQEVSDYIKGYDYNSLTTSPLLESFGLLPVGVNLETLTKSVPNILQMALGSYGQMFFKTTSFKLGEVNKIDGKPLAQDDLNILNNSLSLKINYQYGSVDSSTINLNIVTEKVNLFILGNGIDNELSIPVTDDATKLTDKDVKIIKDTIKTKIQEQLAKEFSDIDTINILPTDYTISGLSEVKIGENFSKGVDVTLTITASPKSEVLTGKSDNTIKVTATK